MDGIVIKDCKNVKLINNHIDVDGNAIVVENSEELFFSGNIIKSNLSADNVQDLKQIINQLDKISTENKNISLNLLDEISNSNDKPRIFNSIRKVLSLIGPIGQGLVIEYLKTKLGWRA